MTQAIRDLFKNANVPMDRDDVWQVQAATVVKHKALERLAAALKIKFDSPTILRAERDEAVILVTASLGDIIEWSIGEACVNVNYRISGKMAAYVYAMAEKRGKDRVILKLAGLHGVYSEDEADDFKRGGQQTEQDEFPSHKAYAAKFTERLSAINDLTEIRGLWKAEQEIRLALGLNGTAIEKDLRAKWQERGIELAKMTEKAA